MHTLLMRLAGPMQSWGTQSEFSQRETGMEPSKSGVIGLLCAALGRPRTEPVDDLALLAMGVRVDREGVIQRDFHTALNVVKADGSKPGTVVSQRFYLADADFLVGLAGESWESLERLDQALQGPRRQLSLGRKAFPSGVPVHLPGGGIRTGLELEDALRGEPWPGPGRLRVVLETRGERFGETRVDQPYGASFATRRFMPRTVRTEFWSPPMAEPSLEHRS